MSGPIERPGAAAVAVALALAGGLVTAAGVRGEASAGPPPTPPPATSGWHRGAGHEAPERVPRRFLPRSVPSHLDIPAIGVHTALVRLGLQPDGTIEVPPLTAGAPAGWYENSVTPGEKGASILVGHVDSARDGPAVFYRLGLLRPGARISVRRADGSTVDFAVTAVDLYPKNDFPTAKVYGPAAVAELRLLTCGGPFDRRKGSYRDNVVVWAAAI